jgi:tetratricopeptide (TPR) repeat protein
MKILKMKAFWVSLIAILIVVSGIAYFATSRVKISFENDDNITLDATNPNDKKISFAKGAEEPFRKGRALIRDRRLSEAIEELKRAAELSPETPVIHYWLGMTYHYKKEPEKAIAYFKKVVDLEPENYRALAMIGRTLATNESRLDQAIVYLDDALSINPEYAEARFDLGRIYAHRGEMKRALSEFAIIFRTEPKYAIYHYEMGRIFEGGKATEQARREYQRALQLNPGFTQAKEALEKLK